MWQKVKNTLQQRKQNVFSERDHLAGRRAVFSGCADKTRVDPTGLRGGPGHRAPQSFPGGQCAASAETPRLVPGQ